MMTAKIIKEYTTLFPNNNSGAVFSDCGEYRYQLFRIWDDTKPLVMFIGLNPSTANKNKNDNTVTKLIKVASNNGFGGFYIVNLFAVISPKPEILITHKNPLGDNDEWLLKTSSLCDKVVFCWGNFKEATDRALKVKSMYSDPYCFVQNKNGSPKHPLYCKDETKLIPFDFTK